MTVSKTTTQERAEKFRPEQRGHYGVAELVEFAELLLYHPQGCGHLTTHGCTICQTCFACCKCDFYTSLEERAKAFTREKYDDEWNDVTDLADFAHSLTAELQKENAEIAKALGIHFCPELEEPWEVPMESEPDYFETLPKAAAFVYAVLDKGLSDREKENARLREALQKLPLDSFGEDMAKHDAADFVDNAGCFFDAMLAARAVLSKEKE